MVSLIKCQNLLAIIVQYLCPNNQNSRLTFRSPSA